MQKQKIWVLYAYINEVRHQDLMRHRLPLLPKAFQVKVLRYKRWQDAQLSMLGWSLMATGLVENYHINSSDIELKYSTHSKPYLANLDVKFNISHSGEIAVCAMTRNNEIGIDVEYIHSLDFLNFRGQMTPGEWESLLNAEEPTRHFFSYWTKKEAVLKAHGKGLSIPLNSFEIANNKATIDAQKFSLAELQLDSRYKCHLAVNSDIETLLIHQGEFIL